MPAATFTVFATALHTLASLPPAYKALGGCVGLGMAMALYLGLIRILPRMNLLVLVCGIALLFLEPVNLVYGAEHAGMAAASHAHWPILVGSGVFLVILSVIGGVSLRRHRERDSLRRQIWARVAEQHN